MKRAIGLLLATALMTTACTSGPILANPSASLPSSRPAPTRAPHPPDPQPVALPRDDAPHDRLTEWWYYTGHIRDALNVRYGFEFVVFRAERGGFPVTWASHVALTEPDGRHVPLRPAQRDRPAGRPVGAAQRLRARAPGQGPAAARPRSNGSRG